MMRMRRDNDEDALLCILFRLRQVFSRLLAIIMNYFIHRPLVTLSSPPNS